MEANPSTPTGVGMPDIVIPPSSPPLKGDAGPRGFQFWFRQSLRNPEALIRRLGNSRETFEDWPMYWISRVMNAPRIRTYRIRNGPRMWLRTGTLDFSIVDEVYRKRIYLPSPDWIPRGGVVVDVGAHIGTFALLASSLNPDGKIIAAEPHPENFDLLRRNVALNRRSNITMLKLGIAGMAGTRYLHTSAFNVGAHSLYIDFPDSIPVTCIALEDLVRQNGLRTIDLLKMDCEGAEHEILRTVSPDTLRVVRRIMLEYHELSPELSADSLSDSLEESGFQVTVDRQHSTIRAIRPVG